MKKSKICIVAMLSVMLGGVITPVVSRVHAVEETTNIVVNNKETTIKVVSDTNKQRIVKETNKKIGKVKTIIFDKINEKLKIVENGKTVEYSKQQLVETAKNELERQSNGMFRSANFGGFWSIGYDYKPNGDHYLKITKDGRVYEKTVRRNGYNASALDAFKYTIDDLVNKEHELFWSMGGTALGVLLKGGLGALTAFGAAKNILDKANEIVNLTNRAHQFYFRA